MDATKPDSEDGYTSESNEAIIARMERRIRSARANRPRRQIQRDYIYTHAEDFWDRHLGDLVNDGLSLGLARRQGLQPLGEILHDAFEYAAPLTLGYIQLGGYINNLALTSWKPESPRTRPKVEALVELHARSLVLFEEICHLTFGGYPAGATSLSRTLHEVRVTARFLRRFESRLSERYLAGHIVEMWTAKDDFRPRGSAARSNAWKKVEQELDARYEEIIEKHGLSMAIPNGWAWPRLRGRYGFTDKVPRHIRFAHIEKAAGVPHDRQRYRHSSRRAHAGRLGDIQTLISREAGVGLLGPRPFGLAPALVDSIYNTQDVTESLLRSCGHLVDDGAIYYWLEAMDQLSYVLRGLVTDGQSRLDAIFEPNEFLPQAN